MYRSQRWQADSQQHRNRLLHVLRALEVGSHPARVEGVVFRAKAAPQQSSPASLRELLLNE